MDQRSGDKFVQLLIHIIAWIAFLTLLFLLVPAPAGPNPGLSVLVTYILFVSFFYFNFYFLVPRFFIKRRYYLYVLLSLTCLFITVAVPSLITDVLQLIRHGNFQSPGPPPDMLNPGFMDRSRPPGPPHGPGPALFNPDFRYNILIFLLIFTLSLGLRIIMKWQQTEKEKINAELASLKAQINPHFLFNALNSIYSLAITRADKTPYAIEMFSNIMRFVIYDTQHDFVPLTKDLEYISNYISLQKLRLSSNTIVNYNVEGDPEHYRIAPLILLPFIENMFKHGISTESKSSIDIVINVENDYLTLKTRNDKFATLNSKEDISKLGIENTRKRLDLIYPGKYSLVITENETEYSVILSVSLK